MPVSGHMEKRELKYYRLWLGIGFFLISFVTFLSLIPVPQGGISFHLADKAYHCAAYTLLMFWFGMIYIPGAAYAGFAAGFILMGALIESVQGVTGYRAFQYSDMLADTAGVLMGLFLLRTRLSRFLVHMDSRISSLGEGH